MQLVIRDLSKTYPNGTRALKDVSLDVPKGMFGLLGRNGAGKSTLMRILATLQEPNEGSIRLGEIDVLRQKTMSSRWRSKAEDPAERYGPRRGNQPRCSTSRSGGNAMSRMSSSLLTVSVAAFLLVGGVAIQPVAGQAAAQAAQEALSDERVMELARGYAEMLFDGEYERLWEHLSPEAQERFGTLEQFRSASETVMSRLGTETLIVRETVEPARVGMIAHKLYHRVSHYTGAEGTAVRLTIGLVNDGSIGGMTARPVR